MPRSTPRHRKILSRSIAIRLGLVAVAFTAGERAVANPITFGPAGTIQGDLDVLKAGEFIYGFTESNATVTVNGVTFSGGNSTTDLGGGAISLSGYAGVATTAFTGGAATPWANLSTEYKTLVIGAVYAFNGVATVSLNNLTVGHSYATQVWASDPRAGGTATRTDTVTGANSVVRDFNSTNAGGGVGQFTTGIFLADAASQSFSMQGAASSQVNAIQLRDVTNLGYWVGTGGASWDTSTTANFATNLHSGALSVAVFDQAKAALNAVTFGDSYWNNGAQVGVTQTAINIANGGVSAGSVIFQNSTRDYTVTSSDALGITGATNVTVTGGGTVTLAGTHSFTGGTGVSNGTLKVGGSTVFNGTGALYMTGTGVLDLNGSNARFNQGLNGTDTSTITDNSAGTGTSTISFLQTNNAGTNTAVLIADGATRSVGVELTNANGGAMFSNANNTFSGGLTLLNSTDGTRLTISTFVATTGTPGTIVSSPFGRGAIVVGQAATDHAGIYFHTAAGNTVMNDIVLNTALGTDRAGIRSDTTDITLAGKITANLADVAFSTNGFGSFNLTGRVTGANGLLLHNQFGANITVTLNNQTGSPNDYQGVTTLQGTKGQINLGAPEQIPNGVNASGVLNNGTINLAGFSETINGLDGTGTVDGGGGSPIFSVGDNNSSGNFTGVISNSLGVLSLNKIGTGAQSLGGANTYTGATNINAGKLFVNGSLDAASSVTVFGGATLGGIGSVGGGVTVNGGGSIESLNGITPGTLTVGGLILGIAPGDLSSFNLRPFAGPAVNVAGLNGLILNGGASSVTVNILGAPLPLGTYTLIDYTGAALTPQLFASFNLGTLPSRMVASLANNGANTSIDLSVTGVDTIRWSGAVSSAWSTAVIAGAKNWVLNSNGVTPTDYLAGDGVSFTDSAQTTLVNISAADVSPASIIFNHSTKNFEITGTAAIAGTTGLTKLGAGTLTISNNNSFVGAVVIENGTIAIAAMENSGVNSPLGAGSAITLGGALNSGRLRFVGMTGGTNRTVTINGGGGVVDVVTPGASLAFSGVISGAGLTKTGPGTLTLSGTNTFSGGLVVSEGTVVAGSSSSLGETSNSIVVNDGASLDLNAQTLEGYDQNFIIAGAGTTPTLGALGNRAAATSLNAVRGITLSGNASIGGDGGRWDIGRIDFNFDPTNTVDHIDGGGFVLTKVGSNYVGLLTGASNLAGFVVNGGTVGPHENTSFGTGPVTVNNGAIIQPWGGTTFDNAFTVNNGTFQNDTFTDTYNGPMAFAGPTTFNTRVGGNIILNGSLGGTASLTKTGPTALLINGDGSSFTGSTTVNQGALLVSGNLGGSAISVNSTGTLGGAGTVGSIQIKNGATLSPGTGIGTLISGTATLESASTLALEIDTTSGTSDVLAIIGNLLLADPDDVILTISDLAPGTPGAALPFITYTGTWDGDLFTFGGTIIPDGGLLTIGENVFTLDYDFGGNSVALIPVPEPNSLGAMLGGLSMLAAMRRYRRRVLR
jgi:fibronectin-binding autotransporter adhesin